MNEKERQSKVVQLRNKKEETIQNIHKTTKECTDIQGEFNSIKDEVQKMVNLFVQAKFSSNVANHMNYDSTTQFNEQNITSYLSELEEYISNLITILAYNRGDPNAAISAVPLERLKNKDFSTKDLVIDAPIDHEIAEVQTQEDSVGAEDNNYNIINSKELYSRYGELAQKGLIKPISSQMTKMAKDD
jgi:hypothetical protein